MLNFGTSKPRVKGGPGPPGPWGPLDPRLVNVKLLFFVVLNGTGKRKLARVAFL